MAEQKSKSALEPHGYILEDEEDRNHADSLCFISFAVIVMCSIIKYSFVYTSTL